VRADSDVISDEFNMKWRNDPELSVMSADYGLVHLLSGFPLVGDPDFVGKSWHSSACVGTNENDSDPNDSDPSVAVAVSWLNHISKMDDASDACKVSLIMHENGHTFSLGHVEDEDAVMYALNTEPRHQSLPCTLTFKTAVLKDDYVGGWVDGVWVKIEDKIQNARDKIKDWAQRHVGLGGCSCSASTAPSPPPNRTRTPPPLPPVTPPSSAPVTPPPPLVPPVEFVSCEVFGRRKKRQCFAKGSGKCIFQKKGNRCLPSPSNGGKCTDYWKRKTCIRAGAPCRWSYRAGGCDSAPAAAATGE